MMEITLFFTKGVSLTQWHETGLFTREVALYERMTALGVRVNFLTYGGREDLAFADQLPGVRILCNRWGLPMHRYRKLMPILFPLAWWRSDLFKTNQMRGAQAALRVGRWWNTPVIVRCGYMLSAFEEKRHGADSARAKKAHTLEAHAFPRADHIVVTTPTMQDDIKARGLGEAISVIPNFVDTALFAPKDGAKTVDVIFIGRIMYQKNLVPLLEALQTTGLTGLIIGEGPLKADLRARFGDLDGKLTWMGNQPHEELPDWLNQARMFVLPSRYEGHPKVLLEAMACGLPVIGAAVPGIETVIEHEHNGLLAAAPTTDHLQACMSRVMADPDLAERLGHEARAYVERHLSLDSIVRRELTLMETLI